jgi:hypothetical protein
MSIYQKLLAVQMEIGTVAKDKTNPHFGNAYADINGYLEAVKPVMNKHGLILLQPLRVGEDGRNRIETFIIDAESGEKATGEITLPDLPDPQKMGSIITYFRRYSLQSILALQAEDDDGNGAMAAPAPRRATQTRQTAPASTPAPTPASGANTAPQKQSMGTPRCSICDNPMKKSAKGAFYCKHGTPDEPVWGEKIWPDKPLSESDKAFLADMGVEV